MNCDCNQFVGLHRRSDACAESHLPEMYADMPLKNSEAWTDLDVEETTIVEFRDPLNARDYAKSLNLLCALYDWSRHLNRGHSQICDCNLCKTLRATDDFLNHRTVG